MPSLPEEGHVEKRDNTEDCYVIMDPPKQHPPFQPETNDTVARKYENLNSENNTTTSISQEGGKYTMPNSPMSKASEKEQLEGIYFQIQLVQILHWKHIRMYNKTRYRFAWKITIFYFRT